MNVPVAVKKPCTTTAILRFSPMNSSIKDRPTCIMEMELVTAATVRSRKNRLPNTTLDPILAKACGSTMKPSAKVPCPAAPATPRNATAAGTVIMPAMPTSHTSLEAAAEKPLSAISSFFLT